MSAANGPSGARPPTSAAEAGAWAPVAVNDRGASRLRAGHPWVYRSDVLHPPERTGFARVVDRRGAPLGWAAVHPSSTIAVRLLSRDDAPIDETTLLAALDAALDRRGALRNDPDAEMEGVTGYRLVHAEADGLPGLVVDRLGPVVVMQNGCAAIEPHLKALVRRLAERCAPRGILGRFEGRARELEGLEQGTPVLLGDVPDEVDVSDGTLTWRVKPFAGQKTGAFLDQRVNHLRFGRFAQGAPGAPRGRGLDVFSYHGGFGLHLLAAGYAEVELVDASADALTAASLAARRNGLPAPSVTQADAFAYLRARVQEGARFDAISVDPPALAKRARDLPRATAGYKELNLRAMRLLAPGGVLATSSCSAHLSEFAFLDVLTDAAADAGRTFRVLGRYGPSPDHPERLGFPESRYLKCVVLQAVGG
ncbi:MAG: class I SAM-dependent rRNA methyltransferase [Trueperaceae bacterium]